MEIDLSQLSARTRDKVDEIFRRDYELKILKAIRRQVKVAAMNALHRPAAQDGFGERVFAIDAQIDALWRSFYGHSYTEDKDLMKFLQRRNPEIGVRSRGTKIQVGYGTCSESRKPVGHLGAGARPLPGAGARPLPAGAGGNGDAKTAGPEGSPN